MPRSVQINYTVHVLDPVRNEVAVLSLQAKLGWDGMLEAAGQYGTAFYISTGSREYVLSRRTDNTDNFWMEL